MFKFARLDIKEKQEKYQIDYTREMGNSIEYEKAQKRIDQLLILKNRIIRCEKKIPLCILGCFLSFFVFGFEDVLVAIIYFIIPCSFTMSGLKAAFDKNKYKKKIQNEYSDLMDMSHEQLQQKSQYLSQCAFDSYHRAMAIRDSNRLLENTLERINHHERLFEDFNELLSDPYYLADSKEEYHRLLEQRQICSKNEHSKLSLEEYLNEPIDYSTVSFDNQISTPIDYTQKTKQLMKCYKKL